MASLDEIVRQQMLAQVNEQHGMILTPSDVTFAAPTLVDPAVDSLSDPDLRNSQIVITTNHITAGVRLTATIKYNRLKLDGLFQIHGAELQYGGETSAHGLIAKVNARLGVELTPDDVQDLPVTVSGENHAVILRATADSLACLGEIELSLLDAVSTDPRIWDGFALINQVQAMFSPDLTSVSIITDSNLPVVDSDTRFCLATGGYENELYLLFNQPNFARIQDSTVTIYMTKDHGTTSKVVTVVGQTFSGGDRSVIFQGAAYYLANDVAEDVRCIYRAYPGSDGELVVEKVMEHTGFLSELHVVDGTLFFVDGEYIHRTADGVNWTRELPPFWVDSVAVHQGKLCGFAFTTNMVVWTRTGPNTYTSEPLSADLIALYPGLAPELNTAFFEMSSFIETPSGELVFAGNYSTADSEGNPIYENGQILKAPSVSGPWARVSTGSGIQVNSPLVRNATRIALVGVHDGRDMGGIGPNWMGYSDDDGDTWTFRDQSDTPFGVNDITATLALGLYRLPGTTPAQVPVVVPPSVLVEPWPNQVSAQPHTLIVEPNDSFVVAQEYLSGINGGRFGAWEERANGISAQWPTGQRDWFRNQGVFNEPYSMGRLSNGKYYVSGFWDTGSEELQEPGYTPGLIARLNEDFTLDRAFSVTATLTTPSGNTPLCRGMHVYPDDRVIVSGNLMTIDGANAGGVVRFNADGTRDTSHTSPYTDSTDINIDKLYVAPITGRIITSGTANTVLGYSRTLVTDANGVLLPGWPDLGESSRVDSFHEYDNGDIVLFGDFPSYPTKTIMIRANGTLDATWVGPSAQIVSNIELDNGDLLLFGYATDGDGVKYVMSPTGTVTSSPSSFMPEYPARKMVKQSTGHYIATGDFTEVTTKPYPFLGQLIRQWIARWHDGTPTVSAYDPEAFVVRHNVNLSHPFMSEGLATGHPDYRFASSASNAHFGAFMRCAPTLSEATPTASTAGAYTAESQWALEVGFCTHTGLVNAQGVVTLDISHADGASETFTLVREAEGSWKLSCPELLYDIYTFFWKSNPGQPDHESTVSFVINGGSLGDGWPGLTTKRTADNFPAGNFTATVKLDGVQILSITFAVPEGVTVGTTHSVDLTQARVYDADQSGDGFLTTGVTATPTLLSVSNADAGVNAFFDPYETGAEASSFYMQWTYNLHYLYNVNLHLTGAGQAEYSANMPDVFWVPGSSLYIEQQFQPKSVDPNFVKTVNVYHMNRAENSSTDGSLTQLAWYESAQPDDLEGSTVRTNVDVIFDGGPGGYVLATRHYLNDILAAAYVWISPLNVTASDNRLALGNWAATVMNTNADSLPYEIANMEFGPRAAGDPNYEEIVFDLGDMAAGIDSGILNFTIDSTDKIVIVAVGTDGGPNGELNLGDCDLYCNVQAGAPGTYTTYALKAENGGLREAISVRDQSKVAADGVYNFVVAAYAASKNVRARVVKIKA